MQEIASSTELNSHEIGTDEWWRAWWGIKEDIEFEISECGADEKADKIKLMNLLENHLMLSAKVNGMLKPGDTNNLFVDKMLVIAQKAERALEK